MLDLFMQMHISGGIVITKVMENFVIVEEKFYPNSDKSHGFVLVKSIGNRSV